MRRISYHITVVVVLGGFYWPLFPGIPAKITKWLLAGFPRRLWDHVGTRASHTEQTNISGEYNYETFKPPLSTRISMSPLFAGEDKQRWNSNHTNRTKSVWDFFFSPHLAPVALLSLVCLTSVFDPEPPDSLEQCNEGDHISRTTHSNLNPR